MLASFAAITLCIVVPVLLWSLGPAADPAAETVITLTLVVAGLRYAWVLGSGERHLHEMVLWLFVYTFLGIAPLLQYRIKFPGTTPNVNLDIGLEGALIVLVGCIALIVGSAAGALGQRRTEGTVERVPSVRHVNGRNTYIWTAIALGLAAVYAIRVGPASLFASRSDLKASQAEGLGTDPLGTLVSAAARMGLVVAFVALMHLRNQRKGSGDRLPRALPVIILITLAVLVNPVSSARYTFGTAFLAVLGALGAYATVRRFRTVAVSSLVGIVFLFPLLDTFRRSLDSTVQLESPLDSMTTGDFDAFAQIINTAEMVRAEGVAWGTQLLGVLFFWVPRSIWPTKPIDTGAEIAEFKLYRFKNLSAPLWSEFFVNFGWVGLIVGMILVGFLLRRLDRRAELTLRVSPLPGVVACITPFYMLILLRGSLLQAMVNLFVILAVSWFVTRPQPAPPTGVIRH